MTGRADNDGATTTVPCDYTHLRETCGAGLTLADARRIATDATAPLPDEDRAERLREVAAAEPEWLCERARKSVAYAWARRCDPPYRVSEVAGALAARREADRLAAEEAARIICTDRVDDCPDAAPVRHIAARPKTASASPAESPVEEIAMSLLDQLYPLPRASHTTRAQQGRLLPLCGECRRYQNTLIPLAPGALDRLMHDDAAVAKLREMTPAGFLDTIHKAEQLCLLEPIAFHEAGHAVAAWLLGRTISEVDIVPTAWHDRESDRTVKKTDGYCKWEPDSGAEEDVVAALAGPVAEAKHTERRPPKENGVSAAIRQLEPRPQRQQQYMERVRSRAEQLLSDPTAWQAVVALAAELLRKQQLTGQEAEQIIATHTSRATRPQDWPC
jgi:hypothetical protein